MAADTGTIKGDVTVVEPSRNQRSIARRIAESRATVPELTLQADVDMTAALALGVDLGVVAVQAAARALRAVPQANASYRDSRYERYSRINVGLTIATEDGFVVPTLFDADQRPLADLVATAAELAERAALGTLTSAEVGGATFTVSHLGALGVGAYAAAILPPQAGALAVGAVEERVVARDGAPAVAPMATLTLTCDHRILYGADAAALLAAIGDALQAPGPA